MQPTKFCTGFILAIHRGNPKQNPFSKARSPFHAVVQLYFGDPPGQSETPCTLVTFSRRFTLLPFKKIKSLAFQEVQIYIHQERMQNKRVTSSTTYFFLRFSFDDEPFHLKILPEKKYIFLRLILFIKAVEKFSSSL